MTPRASSQWILIINYEMLVYLKYGHQGDKSADGER